jgi:hypothetical protein
LGTIAVSSTESIAWVSFTTASNCCKVPISQSYAATAGSKVAGFDLNLHHYKLYCDLGNYLSFDFDSCSGSETDRNVAFDNSNCC